MEILRSNFTAKIDEIASRESKVIWGSSEISIPNLKIDSTPKIYQFITLVREINNDFHRQVASLERDRKEKISVLENRMSEEVRDSIRKEKGAAIKEFMKSMDTYIKDDLVEPVTEEITVSIPSPCLIDLPEEENIIADDLCTICQDSLIRRVTLPCRHCFCFDCMKEFVKDKIDSCELRRKPIEDLQIACPNYNYPYEYLDELDLWLTQNGFDVPAMWGV